VQHRVAEQQAAPEREQPVAERAGHDAAAPVGVLLQLQRELGNRRVRRLLAGMPGLQAKLVVGPLGDRFEREADRVAREVERTVTQAAPATAGPLIRRSPSGAGTGAGGGAGTGPVSDGLARSIGQARGGGRPLPAAVRGRMEQAMGADFGGVRVHTGSHADQLNHDLGAKAFTVGRDIFVRRADADLGSQGGRRVLAHELTHVVQQGGSDGASAVQRDVIQREITDEARAALEEAERNQPGFNNVAGILTDTISFLTKSTTIKAALVQQIIDLPAGAPAELATFVKAWLLRHFLYGMNQFVGAANLTPKQREKLLALLVDQVLDVKKDVIAAGYGQPGGMTSELRSTIEAYFAESGLVPLDFEAHGIPAAPAADPRKVEVCATYIPGGQFNILGRAHSFIIYTDRSGRMTYISAHDDGQGWLKAATGIWRPSSFPDEQLVRVTVAVGHAASQAFPAMLEAVEALNASKFKYKMTKQNCNSATNYFLKAAGLGGTAAPSSMTGQFGWSKKLENKINRPVPYYPTMPALPAVPPTTTAPPVTTQAPALTTVGARTGADTPWHRTDPKAMTRWTPSSHDATRQPSPTGSQRGSTELQAPGVNLGTYRLVQGLPQGAVLIPAGETITVLWISDDGTWARIHRKGRGPGNVNMTDLRRAIGS
jgi:Domain of unknown function (DUF4157)